jgi:hypothetical protein
MHASVTEPTTFVVGRTSAVTQFKQALEGGAAREAQQMLAIPGCCGEFHQTALAGWSDPWWPLACHTVLQRGAQAAYQQDMPETASRLLLLHTLNVPALWYIPCSFVCAAAEQQHQQLHALMVSLGYVQEVEWMRDIARWPVAWSGFHGIAELKTPLFKLIQNTDPIVEKLLVRLPGSAEVEGGARGLDFPFMQRARRNNSHIPVEAIGLYPAE